jgi:uncharacterized membrane protein YfcA
MTNSDDDLRDVRAAWQRERPIAARVTRDQLERKAAAANRRLRVTSIVMMTACVLEVMLFVVFFLRTQDPLRRVGAGLTCLGMLYLAYQMWANLEVIRTLEAKFADAPSLIFHRAFYQQMREWSRGSWFWKRWFALAPGLLLYSGIGVRDGDPPAIFYTFVVLLLLAIALNVFIGAPAMQRRIDTLDAVAGDH